MDLQPLWVEEDYKNKKGTVVLWKCVHQQQEVFLLKYLTALYLHGVCFSWTSLPVGKDSPIVSPKHI